MRDFELWIYHSRMQIIELKMRLNIQFKCHAYDMQWQCYDVFPMKWSKIRWHQTYANMFCCLPRSTLQSLGGFYCWQFRTNECLFQMLSQFDWTRSERVIRISSGWRARKCPISPDVEVCENKISKIQHNIVNTVLFNKNWFKIIIIFCSTFRFTIITILQMGE